MIGNRCRLFTVADHTAQLKCRCVGNPTVRGFCSVVFVASGKSGSTTFRSGSGRVKFITAPASRTSQLKQQIAQYGVAGLLAYGIFNTIYYSVAFLVVVRCSNIKTGLGWPSAAQQFLSTLAIVWAGSQVTKVPRAAAALAFSPAADWILIKTQRSLGLRSKEKAFAVVVGVCFSFAFLLFGFFVSFWA